MKERQTEIAIISILNLIIVLLFIVYYPQLHDIFVIKWYHNVILIASLVMGIAELDITIVGLILLWQKGFAPVIVVTIIAIAFCLSIALAIQFHS